jgi:Carboxypeptidase regulatory-like domain/TonB dependent receptor
MLLASRATIVGVTAAFLGLLCASPLGAEPLHGTVSGTITDSTGAIVTGAGVTVRSLDRGTTDSTVTDLAGHYSVRRLLAGLYELRGERAGFKTSIVALVQVVVDATTQVDLKLEIGGRHEEVRVSSAGQLLTTDRADAAVVFSGAEIQALPLLDRNFSRLLVLTPGGQQLPWQHAASENPQGSVQIMVQGQHFASTAFVLDGIDDRDPLLGIAVINPTVESVAETKVTSQGFDPEFGPAAGAVVAITTRSGSNAFHGSAFEFHQDDRFQARNPFTQPANERLPQDTRNRFGGAIGGPLQRDHWFFFGDYEGLRSSLGGSRLLTVPTARARRGDLGEYGVTIFDPETGPPEERRPFPDGAIPFERISPEASRLLALLPLPNRPGIEDNYLAAGSEAFDDDAFDVRLDGEPNEQWKVFGRYSLADYRRRGPASFGAAGGPELVTLGGRANGHNQSLALGADRVLGAMTTANLRFGFFRYNVDVVSFDYGSSPATDLGLPGLNLDLSSSGLPSFFVTGPYGFTFGSGHASGCNCPLIQDEKQFQLAANLTHVAGAHTLRAGGDIRRAINLRVPSDANRSGELTFSENRTRGSEGGGLGLATLLLGDVTSFRRYVSTALDAREEQWRQSLYAQDVWRASRRLTLNFGLRLDVIDPQTVNAPSHGGWLDLRTGEVRVAGVGGIGLNGDVQGARHWAPRVGATFRASERTVFRMGYGRSYDVGVFGTTFGHTVTQNLPVLSVQELDPSDNFDSVFRLAQGPPAAVFPSVPANGRFPLPAGVYAQALPDRVRLPTVDAWNVTVQREITPTVSGELAYLGSKGTHTFAGDDAAVDVNEPTIAGFPAVPTDRRRPFFAGPIGGIGGAFGWTQQIDYLCSCADTHYDALEAKVTRRFTAGFSLLAHYTLQRVRQDGHAQFFLDRELERARPDWARTHNVVVTSVADLPVGRNRALLNKLPSALDHVLGGWQLSIAVVAQSGLPFDVTYRDAGADRDVGPNRPDVIRDPRSGSGDGLVSPYFNAMPIGTPGSAFARPSVGTFGGLPRNALTGPAYWRVDGSLLKRVPLKAHANLELRLQVVNLFNHVNLGNPDGEIGVPGNDNPGAGFITSTAYSGTDPQRNLQFGLRLAF